MSRLNTERHVELEHQRMAFAINELSKIVHVVVISDNELQFIWEGHLVKLFPYTGWRTGKSIIDGRGLKNLLKQLK